MSQFRVPIGGQSIFECKYLDDDKEILVNSIFQFHKESIRPTNLEQMIIDKHEVDLVLS